jgi:sn-glycerol 3-phosphate transport system ATP-binding protein
MNNGKVEQIDVPEALYSKPKTIFTAQFIGSPPMNIIGSGADCRGIRPEHIEISEQGMPASVVSCDYHGADTIVLADVSEHGETQQLIKIRYPGHAVFTPQQRLAVRWSPENEHKFTL